MTVTYSPPARMCGRWLVLCSCVPLWILPKTALWDGFDIILVAAGVAVQIWALLDPASCVARPG